MIKIDRIEWPGPYCYEVTAGRIKIGQRYYGKGDRVYLNAVLAKSLYPSGQLRYRRTIVTGAKRPRHLVPGELIGRLPIPEKKRLPLSALKAYALKFGIIETDKGRIIRRIPWLTARSLT